MSAFSQKRKLARLTKVEYWSHTILREKLIKFGTMVVRQGRYINFQLEEIAIPRPLFAEFRRLVDGLRPAPLPS